MYALNNVMFSVSSICFILLISGTRALLQFAIIHQPLHLRCAGSIKYIKAKIKLFSVFARHGSGSPSGCQKL
jgi:hypothetical protein